MKMGKSSNKSHKSSKKSNVAESVECFECGIIVYGKNELMVHMESHNDIKPLDIVKDEKEDILKDAADDLGMNDMIDKAKQFDELANACSELENILQSEESKINWKLNDKTVPVGWKTGVVKEGSSESAKCFMAPSGKICTSRIEALKWMRNNVTFSMKDKALMKEGLWEEEWKEAAKLPKDWRVQRQKDQGNYLENVFHYLTPDFEVLKTSMDIWNYMNTSKIYEGVDTKEMLLNILTYSESTTSESSASSVEISVHEIETTSSTSETTAPVPENGDGYVTDRDLPVGWKVKNAGKNKMNFLTVDGKELSSVTSALQYMVKQRYSDMDISLMTNNLLKCGWKSDTNIPSGWYFKVYKRSGLERKFEVWFLTSCYKILPSTKAAVQFIERNSKYSFMDAKQIIAKSQSITSKIESNLKKPLNDNKSLNASENTVDNISPEISPKATKAPMNKSNKSKDQNKKWSVVNVPKGWKMRSAESANDRGKRFYFVSPKGNLIKGIIEALKCMIRQGLSEKDINATAQHLKDDGWKNTPGLPKGWFMKLTKKSKDVHFLTSKFKLFTSTSAAIKFLNQNKNDENYPIKNLTDVVKKSTMDLKLAQYEWTSGNGQLPSGWKMREVQSLNDRGKRQFFLAPDGTNLTSVSTAVLYMVQNKYSVKDIQNMIDINPVSGKETVCVDALKKMKRNGKYTKQEMLALKEHFSNKSGWLETDEFYQDESVPFGWKIKSFQSSNGQARSIFRSPEGEKFKGAIAALQYMVKESYSDKDISKVAKLLKRHNWEKSEKLPDSWYIKLDQRCDNKSTNVKYLTNRFEVLNTKSARVLMEKDDSYGKDDINKLLSITENELQKNRENGYEWMSGGDSLPKDWKMRSVLSANESKARRIFFMSPDGKQFPSVKAAIEFMASNGYHYEKIKILIDTHSQNNFESDVLTAVEQMKKAGNYTKEEIVHFKDSLSDDSSWKESDEFISDTDIPLGWKIKTFESSNGQARSIFRSPDGKKFKGAITALQYMVKENYSQKDIHIIEKLLVRHNWKRNENLPEGWYIKLEQRTDSKSSNVTYLTNRFEVLNSTKAAKKLMERDKKYTDNDVDKLLSLADGETQKNREIGYEWISDENSLPKGWKTRSVQSANERGVRIFFMSSDGKNLPSVKTAIQHMANNQYQCSDLKLLIDSYSQDEDDVTEAIELMRKNGNYKDEDIVSFRECFSDTSRWRESDEVGDGSLPKGWKLKITQAANDKGRRVSFMPPDGKTLKCVKSAVEYMVKLKYQCKKIKLLIDTYSTNSFEADVMAAVDQMKKSGHYRKKDIVSFKGSLSDDSSWKESDDFNSESEVPKGWKIKNFHASNGQSRSIFRSPDGNKFKGVIAALQHMKKKNHSKNDIDIVAKLLKRCNWLENSNLPSGWYIKMEQRSDNKATNITYLTNDFQVIGSTKSVKKMMERNAAYSKEDIDKLVSITEAETQKNRENGYEWVSGGESLPKDWKMRSVQSANDKGRRIFFMSPDGKNLPSVKAAIEHMVMKHYPSKEIKLLIDTFSQNSFEDDVMIAVDLMKKDGNYGKQDVISFRKSLSDDSSWRESDDFISEANVPHGWKIKLFNSSDGKPRMLLRSPDDKKFKGPLPALQHMMKEKFPKKDIDMILNLLLQTGWKIREELPERWYIKINSRTDVRYLTPTFDTLTSTKSAAEYMMIEGYNDEDISKLKDLASKLTVFNDDEVSVEGEKVPSGWKIKTKKSTDGNNRTYLHSPDGTKFKGAIPALQYMLKINSPPEDIRIVSQMLVRTNWVKHDSLPPGWYIQIKSRVGNASPDLKYLTPTFEVMESTKLARQFMNKGNYGENDIQNLLTIGEEFLKTNRQTTYDWTDGGGTLPKGWTMRVVQSANEKGRRIFFMTTDGTSLQSVKTAVQYMVKNKYPIAEIKLLIESHSENALESDVRWAVQQMKNKGNYTKEEVLVFKGAFLKDDSWKESDEFSVDENVPFGWQIKNFTSSNGQSRMLLRSPDGIKFKGPILALKHMSENNYSREDIDKVLNTLSRCGWEYSEKLPPGFFIKVKSSKDVRYLTPTFEVLTSIKAVKSYMESIGYSEPQYFDNIDSITEIILREERERVYQWSTDRVPEGWKVRIVESANDRGKRIFFMGPDGQNFPSVKAAVQYMAKVKYSLEDIIKLVENHAANGSEADFKAALDEMKKTGNYSTDEIINFTNISSSDGGWKESDEFGIDENVPFGWRMKFFTSSDGKPRMIIHSSEGTKFKGPIPALKHMLENSYEKEDIGKILNTLAKVGWETSDKLPPGWFIKVKSARDVRYLTPTFDVLTSLKAVKAYIENVDNMDNSQAYNLDNLNFSNVSSHDDGLKIGDGFSSEENVPSGWKVKYVSSSDGKPRTYIRLPNGKKFKGAIPALQYMFENNFPADDIEKVVSLLKNSNWDKRPDLPKGWRFKAVPQKGTGKVEVQFLTQKFEVLKTTKAAISYMTIWKYDLKDLENIKSIAKDEAEKMYSVQGGGDTVPPGWKTKLIKKTNKTQIISPSGDFFSSRSNALKYMIQKEYPTQQIDEMRNKLKHEGWEEDVLLPTGWKIKQIRCKNKTVKDYFLSPDGTHLNGRRNAIDYMMLKGYDGPEIHMLRESLKMQGWISTGNFLPHGWMQKGASNRFLSPNNQEFTSLPALLEFLMYNPNENEQFINNVQMRMMGVENVEAYPGMENLQEYPGDGDGILPKEEIKIEEEDGTISTNLERGSFDNSKNALRQTNSKRKSMEDTPPSKKIKLENLLEPVIKVEENAESSTTNLNEKVNSIEDNMKKESSLVDFESYWKTHF